MKNNAKGIFAWFLFCFVSNHSILVSNILLLFFFLWWKYLENITSLRKAITTNHLQNKLVHINCIFHLKWVADIILRMYKLSNVAAENKSSLELSPGQDTSGIQRVFGGAPLPFPWRPDGSRSGVPCLAHSCFGQIQKLFCLPSLEPEAHGFGRDSLWAPRVVEPVGHCFLFS